MTRTKHDQFAKELLSGLLETVGIPGKGVKVTSEVREIDLLFVPLREKAADREKLGLLGRIAATACITSRLTVTPRPTMKSSFA